MNRNHHCHLRVWLAIFGLLVGSSIGWAQEDKPIKGSLKGVLSRPRFNFTKDDYVRFRIEKDAKTTYFVGEPVVIPIVLSNHTVYPITISTNFIPRSMLHVIIRQSGKPSRNYNGPYVPGNYSPIDIFLFPLEEYHHQFVMWSAPEQPGGLAFPDPGEYTIAVSQTVNVIEGKVKDEMEVGSITIKVLPTPAEFQPLVDAIKGDKAAYFFHLRKLPPNWEKNTVDYLQNLPPNPITPYLALSYADFLQEQWVAKREQKETADKLATSSLYFYQSAAKSDSAFKLDAYNALLKFLDRIGESEAAAHVAQEVVQVMPRDRRGKLGESKLLKKYLINSEEIDPSRYWMLLE